MHHRCFFISKVIFVFKVDGHQLLNTTHELNASEYLKRPRIGEILMRLKTDTAFLVSFLFTLVLFLSITTFEALAETGKRPNANMALNGKKLYETYCQSCHGEKGIGEQTAPSLIRSPTFFNAPALNDSQHAWHHTDEDLINFILKGSPRTQRMAAWGKILSKSDASDLVDYMKSLWGSRALECQGPKHMSCM
jgi:mono/diheme cytochrome c family protein